MNIGDVLEQYDQNSVVCELPQLVAETWVLDKAPFAKACPNNQPFTERPIKDWISGRVVIVADQLLHYMAILRQQDRYYLLRIQD